MDFFFLCKKQIFEKNNLAALAGGYGNYFLIKTYNFKSWHSIISKLKNSCSLIYQGYYKLNKKKIQGSNTANIDYQIAFFPRFMKKVILQKLSHQKLYFLLQFEEYTIYLGSRRFAYSLIWRIYL